ncbi:MAG: GNAT family N-acetyltransferase [bacterium]
MVREVKTLPEFQEIAGLWDDLYQRSQISNLFLTHAWLNLWIRHFGNGQTFTLLYLPDGTDDLEAGVVLKRHDKAIGFIDNNFSAYPDFLATPQSTGGISNLLAYLRGKYYPPKLVFADTSTNSLLCRNVDRLARERWIPISKYPSQMRAVALAGTFDDYLSAQGAKFRSEIRRKVRRAQREHRVSLKLLSQGHERDEVFELIRIVEQDSWKAQAGSAIIRNEDQMHFYQEVFDHYAGQNKARVYALYFNDQPVSFVLGILSDRKYYALKTSYRLDCREYAPGLVLFAMVLDSLFHGKEADRLEFLGSDARWKEEFSNHREDFCTLELYPMGLKSLTYSILYRYIRPIIKRLKTQYSFLSGNL